MKILVIFTGGTIGSSVKDGWADVDHATRYALLKNFQNNPDIEFVTRAPFSVLSENLSARELNLLQNEIEIGLEGDFDGIIVTHGTDTLQYTAAATEFAFADTEIPIIFVSADYPLENPKTNGYDNFKAAVEWICGGQSSGVFVSYRNKNEKKTDIHIASRLLQHSEFDSDLYSLGGVPFAVYDEKIQLSGSGLLSANPIGKVEYAQNPDILSIESCPGNRYNYPLDGVNAVLLKPYHSGTLDTANTAFCDFCRRVKEKKIPLFIANTATDVSYKSTELYEELGIIPLPYGTCISAYVKIWAAVSLGKNVPEFMKIRIANEYEE